jgi:hypothetical protein
LNLSCCSKLEDITALASCAVLKHLNLANCSPKILALCEALLKG